MAEVLVVENDHQLASLLQHALTAERHRVLTVSRLAEAYAVLSHRQFDLALVDLVLDDGNGLELVEYLHLQFFPTRTMIISQLGAVAEKITGFKQGADDYLVKPFALEECHCRVQRLLASKKMPHLDKMEAAQLTLYPETGEIILCDGSSHLRRRETQILACLLQHKNQVVTREMLIDQIWTGESEIPTYSTIDVYLRRLRMALGRQGEMIKTVRGFGYLLKDA